jgi:hypothetical protein
MWTYNDTQLATSPLYQVRFVIGDTNAATPLLQDEEINFILSQNGNSPDTSSLVAIRRIIAILTRQVDYAIGPEKVYASQRLANYQKLMEQINEELKDVSHLALAPIVTHFPIFSIGMDDNRDGSTWPSLVETWIR